MPASTTKCDGCGLESEQAEIFQSVHGSFSKKLRTLCPVCFSNRDNKVYILLFWGYVALIVIALLLIVLLPSASIGSLLLNIGLLQLFVFICTVIHELGHACAGRLVGFRVFGIEIGKGQIISEFMLGGLRWQFRAILFGGCVHGTPRNTKQYKLKENLFILGGPLANIILMGVAIWALPLDDLLESGTFKGSVPVLMFLLSNAALLAYSLWPCRVESRYGKTPNDILLIWETWRRPRTEVKQLPAHWYFLESQESQRQGRPEEARDWIIEGLRLFPQNYWLEWMQASNLMEMKKHGEARRAYVLLLGRYHKFEELRYTCLNNIAYIDLLSGDPQLLEEAEICSH